ncbi:MAG: dual specificity protein phosphatase family protein [Verrucomicrobiota bacterium]|nr:dual specificity protein phosphatase family protein [Verrucomicrobiota bacterium]
MINIQATIKSFQQLAEVAAEEKDRLVYFNDQGDIRFVKKRQRKIVQVFVGAKHRFQGYHSFSLLKVANTICQLTLNIDFLATYSIASQQEKQTFRESLLKLHNTLLAKEKAKLISKLFKEILIRLDPMGEHWMELQEKTQKFSLPESQAFPSKQALYPTCRWVEKEDGSYYPLSAHWIGKGWTDRKIIAFQYPSSQSDWEMMLQYRFLIIDLTTPHDLERVKREGGGAFYPTDSTPSPKFPIHYKGMKENRHLYRIKGPKDEAVIQRVHFDKWTDGWIVSINDLDQLVNLCLSHKSGVMIHCYGGVGRTGTLITASILKEKIKKGELTKENLHPELLRLICDLRKQRAKLFVQTFSQFKLLHSYGSWLLNKASPKPDGQF